MAGLDGDLGFRHLPVGIGEVRIVRGGKVVTVLRAEKAEALLAKLTLTDFSGQQQLMARITGNYKRGNERTAKNSPKQSPS